MDFVPTLGVMTLIIAIINFILYIKNKNVNGIVTTLAVWVAGVVTVSLLWKTDFADTFMILDKPLGTYNFASVVFIGLTISAMAQFAVEIKKAIDGHDTAVKPPMIEEHPPA